jgi:hypothetical protein
MGAAAPVDYDASHSQVDVAHATIDDDEPTQPSQPVEPIVANFDAAVRQAAAAAEEQEATATQHASTTPEPVAAAAVAREPAATPDAARNTTPAGAASAGTAAPRDTVRIRSFPQRLSSSWDPRRRACEVCEP